MIMLLVTLCWLNSWGGHSVFVNPAFQQDWLDHDGDFLLLFCEGKWKKWFILWTIKKLWTNWIRLFIERIYYPQNNHSFFFISPWWTTQKKIISNGNEAARLSQVGNELWMLRQHWKLKRLIGEMFGMLRGKCMSSWLLSLECFHLRE